MSVRKLALALKSRVNELRESLVAKPRRKFHIAAIVAGLACSVQAISPNDCFAQETLPVQDPFAFDPDFNWFEPIYQADFDDMQPKKRANRGWYGAYDRLHLFGSRPEQEQGSHLLDGGWGNRYDLGYMLDEDTGWMMSYIDVGIGQFDGYDRERLNRLNTAQLSGTTTGGGGGGGAGAGGTPGPPFGLLFPIENRNNPGFNSRFVPIRDSENVVNFDSFELNKTWRLEPYHYGGMLEPLVGVRYMKYSDLYQRMSYTSGLFPTPLSAAVPPALPPTSIAEQVLTQQSLADNEMFGGQLGFRYFKYQNRFRYSGEFRVFAMGNFQTNKFETTSETTYYPGTTVAQNAIPTYYLLEKSRPLYGRNEEFAFGFDAKAELSYQLSRMFEIRGGVQMIDIAQGLWRGRLTDPTVRNDQQALMLGGTFGFAINR